MDPKVARSRISGRKARGGVVQEKSKSGAKSVEAQEFDAIYTAYEEALKVSNLLDYDDLLLRCVELLRDHPDCVSNVEAVLIDEFQDTNLVQFDLMRLFASQRKRITIVGDPDQSIYGFRAAEIKNYKRMLRQYPDTVTIALEENYRSSASILMSALSVIEQDDARVKKSLMPTHLVGTRPVLRKLAGAYKEAEWIVTEIQRCQGMTGGLRFYDRMEIKTILDYLRVINQPDNNDALARIINTPSRRIGDATIKSLLEEADRKKVTLWSLLLGTVQGRQATTVKIQKQAEQALSKFVNIILTAQGKLKSAAKDGPATVELINFVLEKTNYERWLEEHHNDVTKARWDNVKELITQAADFQDLVTSGYEDEALPEIEGLEQQDDDNHLSKFLSNVALASEVKNDDVEGTQTAQVTISTIHAAKGLEWPVVFIPAAYEGSIPHSRADDVDEERRLLYVAMTRAKALLYMSWKPTYTTTMARAATFTAPSLTMNSGFVSAGSHLQVLNEQSVNAVIEEKQNSKMEKQKSIAKGKAKKLEGQGNLSPPRPAAPILREESPPLVKQEPALSRNPPLMPLIRPAITMHTTSVAKLQSSNNTAKRTLGVKRSLDDQVRTACETTGFFQITGHGIPRELQDEVFAGSARLFALSMDEKKKLDKSKSVGASNRGYEIIGNQGLQEGTLPDLKEGFYIGRDIPSTDPRVQNNAFLLGPNQWPSPSLIPFPLFRHPMERYYTKILSLSLTILDILAATLPYGPNVFKDFTSNDPIANIRLLHYPPDLSNDERQLGAGAHTDFGAITLLLQDEIGGLQGG
ncbi:putative ATP-dependent DNA helicase srs2 [Glarea lozoyensis 74030]|uniref:DNA 3'-5' helicase n=1 Tax=Glarea lozoyensis (strain ATCC 74030 / MF5533) TaxID=1104152 RepID=H0EEB8_GLAL7|nr:putative ATP-dependent DNA helicase srs2 [Glarea lozoyensis 74030]